MQFPRLHIDSRLVNRHLDSVRRFLLMGLAGKLKNRNVLLLKFSSKTNRLLFILDFLNWNFFFFPLTACSLHNIWLHTDRSFHNETILQHYCGICRPAEPGKWSISCRLVRRQGVHQSVLYSKDTYFSQYFYLEEVFLRGLN